MSPEEHYAKAEEFAERAEAASGAAPDAAIKDAILAVAHAVMAASLPPKPQHVPLLPIQHGNRTTGGVGC